MKKLLYILAIAGILAVSCTKEPTANDAPKTNTYTFVLNASADIDTEFVDATKTAYANDKTFSWTAGDKISVLFHKDSDNKFFTLTADAGGSATATFRGEVTDGYTIGASDDGTKWALYPASDEHVYNPSYDWSDAYRVLFKVPDVVDFSTGEYSANIPMRALGDADDKFEFTPIAAAFKFTFIVSDDVSTAKLTVSQASSYYLSGLFPFRNSDNGYLAFEKRHDLGAGIRSISITRKVEKVGDINKVSFYVPYRIYGNLTPTISLYDADKDKLLYTGTAKAATQASDQRHITVFPTKNLSDYELSFKSKYGIDWDNIAAFSSNTSRIVEWKAASDATNLYFYFKVPKEKITWSGSSYNWDSYIYTAFDTDDDHTTESADVGAALGKVGWNAMCALYPFRGTTEGVIEFVNGDDPNGKVQCPVGTDAGIKVNSFGALIDDFAYVESKIPRDKIGCSASGLSVRVNHSFSWSLTGDQTITLQ